MVVITLEKCPISLRGDLTKWLLEINTGVYVGQISARVRDNLWKRVCAEAKQGRATMVYSSRNEQHLDFRVHNSLWEPIDFDGMKLMLRPSAQRLRERGTAQKGFSDVSKRRHGSRSRSGDRKRKIPEIYVVLDIETTGLDPERDEIIEIGALRVIDGQVEDSFSTLVRCEQQVPREITGLTGISQADVDEGMRLEEAVNSLLRFVRTYPLVMHNAEFDMDFIDVALERFDIDSLENKYYDTIALAKKKKIGSRGYRLGDLCSSVGIVVHERHRAIADCELTKELFERLLDN